MRTALAFMIVLIVVLVGVLRVAMSNRLGGEPRRSPFRRTVVTPTVPPDGNPTDPFGGDRSVNTDPNVSGLESTMRRQRMNDGPGPGRW